MAGISHEERTQRKNAQERLDRLTQVVISRKRRDYPYDRKMLKWHVEHFGFPMMESLIQKAMDMDWLKPQEWQLLARLYKAHGIERCEWAIERAAALSYHSIDSVEGLLTGRIPARRAPQKSNTLEVRRPVADRQYPPPDHIYYQNEARRWLTEHNLSHDDVWQIFERAGENTFKLKSEYR